MFQKKQKSIHKEWLRKMDTVITGLILGGVVASIYGITRKKKIDEIEKVSGTKRKMLVKVLKVLLFGLKKEEEAPKSWLFQKLFKKR